MSNKTPTTWYHGTTEEAWKRIQKDGSLLGKHNDGKRYTYLALEKEEADCYGDVTLRIKYDPTLDLDNNNFYPDCLEMRVASPIKIAQVKRIK